MSKPSIIVTGAHGQLGNELRVLSGNYPAFDFVLVDRDELSIDDAVAVRRWFEQHQPVYCINCAAYTAVDKAETEKELAMMVNGEAPGILAAACTAFNTRFIHISTDYVFDGTATTPYLESDATSPVNYYGVTKLRGEQSTLAGNPNAIILRTAWVYSTFGHNFVKTMMRLMKEKQSLNVVNDQVGSPTYARDLAQVILTIVDKTEKNAAAWVPGIFHYSNEGVISWYDFAVAIQQLTNSSCIVNGIPTSGYPTPARRPAYSVFNKEKIKATYKITIPTWQESLAACVKNL